MGKHGRNDDPGDQTPVVMGRAGKILVVVVLVSIALVMAGIYMLLSCWGPDHAKC